MDSLISVFEYSTSPSPGKTTKSMRENIQKYTRGLKRKTTSSTTESGKLQIKTVSDRSESFWYKSGSQTSCGKKNKHKNQKIYSSILNLVGKLLCNSICKYEFRVFNVVIFPFFFSKNYISAYNNISTSELLSVSHVFHFYTRDAKRTKRYAIFNVVD